MTAELQPTKPVEPHVDPVSTLLGRRRLLRGGLGAAPVLMTFVSGPVSAGSCLQPSGFVSMPTMTSRHPNGLNNCAGKSPSSWASTPDSSWPGGVKANNLFKNTFTPALATNSINMLDVLKGYTAGIPSLPSIAGAIVALWLNAQAGLTGGVFSSADALALWTNIAANNGYKPTSGPAWTLQATQNWLALTWT